MGANTRDATALAYFAGNRPMYPQGRGSIGVMNFLVDMAVVAEDLGYTIDANNVDVIQLWDIPAMTHILSVGCHLYVPEGAAATITLGDGDAAAGWMASFSINGAADTESCTIITDANMLTGGKMYKTTDTFDITFATGDTDVSVAVFGITIACIFHEFLTYDEWVKVAPTTWH